MGNLDEITDVEFLDAEASRIAVSSNAAALHIFDAQSATPSFYCTRKNSGCAMLKISTAWDS